jgi:hypothetical protein
MSTDMMDAFEDLYKEPQRCGYSNQIWFINLDMKDIVNEGKTLIDG